MHDNFFKDEKIVGKRNVFLQKKADNTMCCAHNVVLRKMEIKKENSIQNQQKTADI